MSEPRVLIYASYLLDIALLKYEFVEFKTSLLTICALAIALQRDQTLQLVSYEEQLSHLNEVKKIERLDSATFLGCKR